MRTVPQQVLFIVVMVCIMTCFTKLAESKVSLKVEKVSSTTLSVIPRDDAISQIMCGMVVGVAQQKLVKEKKSMEETEQELIKFCSLSSFSKNATMMNMCHDMALSFVPHVLSEILIAHQEPLAICQRQKRGVEYALTRVREQNQTIVCNICQLLVYEVELFIAQNESLNQLAYKLEEVCSTVPETYQGLCIYTVEQYLPSFIKMVESELSPLSSCQMIGYCPTTDNLTKLKQWIEKKENKVNNVMKEYHGCGKRRFEKQILN